MPARMWPAAPGPGNEAAWQRRSPGRGDARLPPKLASALFSIPAGRETAPPEGRAADDGPVAGALWLTAPVLLPACGRPGPRWLQGPARRAASLPFERSFRCRAGEKRPLPSCRQGQAYREADRETKCSHASAMRFQHPLSVIIGGGLSGIQWILTCKTRSFRD